MSILRLAFKRETAMPMLALLFASAASVLLVSARVISTGKVQYFFLIWNLALAWVPLIFALLAKEEFRRRSGPSWTFHLFSAIWLLFFPNAPYILTDLIHLTNRFQFHFWVDLELFLICALTGLVLGFVSMFLMQSLVRRLLGSAASWLFIAVVAGLSGFGIYLGRFLRFNSWDLLFRPRQVYRGLGNVVSDPFGQPVSLGFAALFATFLFITYIMLYALTHLEQSDLPKAELEKAPKTGPSKNRVPGPQREPNVAASPARKPFKLEQPT